MVVPLYALVTVRCLGCGALYAKPDGGGTIEANPGCPRCGYVGWLGETLPVTLPAPPRSAEGPLRPLSARPG